MTRQLRGFPPYPSHTIMYCTNSRKPTPHTLRPNLPLSSNTTSHPLDPVWNHNPRMNNFIHISMLPARPHMHHHPPHHTSPRPLSRSVFHIPYFNSILPHESLEKHVLSPHLGGYGVLLVQSALGADAELSAFGEEVVQAARAGHLVICFRGGLMLTRFAPRWRKEMEGS